MTTPAPFTTNHKERFRLTPDDVAAAILAQEIWAQEHKPAEYVTERDRAQLAADRAYYATLVARLHKAAA